MDQSEDHIMDDQLEQILMSMRKYDPEIQCPSGNRITRLCTNPNCKVSIRCEDGRCKTCGKITHLGCMSIQLEDITDLINSKFDESKIFMSKIIKVEEEFIAKMRRTRNQFIQRLALGSIDNKSALIIKKLYSENDCKNVNGKEANQLLKILQTKTVYDEDQQKQRIQKYTLKLPKTSNIRQSVFLATGLTSLLEVTTCGLGFAASQALRVPSSLFSFLSDYVHDIDSKVLRLKGDVAADTRYIYQMLNKPIRLQLLYRGSSKHSQPGSYGSYGHQQFRSSEFHKNCDNVNNTFTLMRTSHGKTIGGFSYFMWNQVHNGYYRSCNEEKDRVFLLHLDLKQKLVASAKQNPCLIYCHPNYGPCFGEGDIQIVDSAHQRQSSSSFPSSFDFEGKEKSQNKLRKFCGNSEGRFTIVEYEVYKLG